MTENFSNILKNPKEETFSLKIAIQIINFLRRNQSALINKKGDAFTQINRLTRKGFLELEIDNEETEGLYKLDKRLFNEIIFLMAIDRVKSFEFGEDTRPFFNQYLQNCYTNKQEVKTLKLKKQYGTK